MGITEQCRTDLDIVRGEDRVHEFEVLRILDETTNPRTTTPLDLTGCTPLFTVKEYLWDSDSEAILQKTLADGITLTDAENGLLRVKVEHEDVDAIDPGLYYWDLQVELGEDAGAFVAGSVLTALSGRYEVKETGEDHLHMVREDTNIFNVQASLVTDAEANPVETVDVDLTSATFSLVVRERLDDSGSAFGAATFTIVDASQGQFQVLLDPSDTASVEMLGEEKREFLFWVLVTLGTGTRYYSAGDVLAPYSGTLTLSIDRTWT